GKQLKSIIENMNGGVTAVTYDDDGGVRHAYRNDRYLELFGYTAEQYANELKKPYAIVSEEDIAKVRSVMEHIRSTGRPATFRFRANTRDGRKKYISCSSSLATIEGFGSRVVLSVMTDITAAVETEQQALVFGQRLNAIMGNINNGVAASILHKDGTVDYVFVTDRFYEIHGYTREQYHQEVTDPFQLIYCEDLDAVRKTTASLHKVNDSRNLKYRVVRRDGRVIWLDVEITMMSFADVEEPVQLAVLTDITHIMEAAEKIKAQRDEINEMLNTTPSGIAVVEIDPKNPASMHTTYYNDRFFSFSGCTREEYDAIIKENETSFVFEEDVPVMLADIVKICAGDIGTSKNTTIRCHTKDGGYRWLLLTGQLAEKRGDTCVLKVSLVDITARKDAEDRQRIGEEMLRLAAETDKRALITYDVKANACHVESRNLYSAGFGETLTSIPESLIERKIVAQESVAELNTLFSRIRSGESRLTVSLQLRTGETEYQWFECNASVVFDADHQPDHAVLVFHNITEQRIKEAVYRKWQNSIQTRPPASYTLIRSNLCRDASADEEDGELLRARFFGDLCTFNERTQEYAKQFIYPEDQKDYVALVNSDVLLSMFYRGEHVAEIEYRELVNNAEPVWRKLTIEMVEYPHSTDVQAFLLFEDIDKQKKEELKAQELRELDPLTGALTREAFVNKLEAIVKSEPALQHALLMLDMDGLKQLNDVFGYTAGDQSLVDVASVLRSISRKGDLVCRLGGDVFLVWQRDIPYDAAIEKAARQMCEQIRKVFSSDVKIGASIGIAVYPRDGRSFNELYGKADKALSKVKRIRKGSYAFYNATAQAQEQASLPAKEAATEQQTVPKRVDAAKRRMLIVDDSETTRALLQRWFQDEFLIETAKNGAEAMLFLKRYGSAISIVLLDLMMPDVDGYTVLQQMQENTDLRAVPVIVVSADNNRDTLLKAIEGGAADYITKPIDVDLIRIRVKAVISKMENEKLRAQNSYLLLQRDEEMKFQTVLESTGTVVVEYNWLNQVFIYDSTISNYIAGNYDNRRLWKVFLSDLVADSLDVKAMQEMMQALANNRDESKASMLVMLKTPFKVKHWFRMNVYKQVGEFGLTEKLFITFNDVHEEVLTNEKLLFQATRDELTGLYNRAGFIEKASQMIAAKSPGYYVMSCMDIERFKVINDQYGTEKGDEVLRQFAKVLSGLNSGKDVICCRVMADCFAALFPARLLDTSAVEANHTACELLDGSLPPLKIAAGRCKIDDKTLDVSAIYDRASIAKNTVKGRYDTYVAVYDESMRTVLLRQQEITGQMKQALATGQFEAWLQPQ
ncbi:MAG: diguanylate cyclase, partial [Eubacteriales bacterium]|nr:diguanylate cyclase [Eubacteriales bacterium]